MGIEPITSCLQGRRSSHLSYDPIFGGYWSELNRHFSNSQLDALPIKLQTHKAGVVGLEPTTFEVEARSSIPLSYTPNIW